MENIRTVLALIAAFVGIILILSALFRLRVRRDSEGPRRERSLGWLFGCLFLVVGAILWYRGSPELSSSLFPDKSATAKVETPSTTPETKPQAGSHLSTADRTSVVEDELSEEPESKSTASQPASSTENYADAGSSSKIEPDVSGVYSSPSSSPDISPLVQTELPAPRVKNLRKAKTSDKSGPQPNFDEVVYDKVNRLFTLIENFFDKYGEPSPLQDDGLEAPRSDAIAKLKQIEFPAIEFASGTADLTYDSQMALCTLATKLNYSHTSGILEIQAHVDSVGPEAFNFVLTQARAEAVRDYLISEGVPAQRLIAVGRGTEGQNTIADSGIEFVVR